MVQRDTSSGRQNWASVAVALGVTLLGVGIVVGLAYADRTADLRADYTAFQAGCDDLANQSRLVDGGLGMERKPLNQTHVRQCKNTTYAEYRAGRLQSLTSAPISLVQWVLYGGVGGAIAALGAVLLRQELSSGA